MESFTILGVLLAFGCYLVYTANTDEKERIQRSINEGK